MVICFLHNMQIPARQYHLKMGSSLSGVFLLAVLIYIRWKNTFLFYVNQTLRQDTLYFPGLI